METLPDTPLTQKQIADRSGVSISMISHVMKGTKRMSLKVQFVIWQHEQVTLNDRPLTAWRDVFKQARLNLGWSQQKLAEAVGYSQRISVVRVENGKSKTITLEKFNRFIEALQINITKGLRDEHSTNEVRDEPAGTHEHDGGGDGVGTVPSSEVPRPGLQD